MKTAWEKETGTESVTLRGTLRDMTETFLSKTSLHGMQHVTNGGRHKLARCLWLMAVLGMAGWLISTLLALYVRYQSHPHVTTIKVLPSDNLPVPALTVCLKDPLDRNRLRQIPMHDLIEDFFVDRSSIPWENATIRSLFGNLTLQQVMDIGSFSVEEIGVYGSAGLVPAHLDWSRDFTTNDYILWEFPNRCYTFNPEEREPAGGIKFTWLDTLTLYLQVPQDNILPFDTTGGIFVAVHEPSDTVHTFSSTDVAIGTAVTLTMRTTEYRYLPAPYKTLGGKDCLDTESPGFPSPLRHYSKYTYFNCFREYLTNATTSACNCTTIGDLGDYGLPECTLLQIRECYLPRAGKAALYVISSTICQTPCRVRFTEIKATSAPRLSQRWYDFQKEKGILDVVNLTMRDMIKLSVKFEDTMQHVTEHVPALTLDDIYSQVGGQMGLFVGASLLTIAELGEHVIFLMWTALKRLRCKRSAKIDKGT